MANCHDLFTEFNTNIGLTKTKKDNLMEAKDTLRDRIAKHFRENHPEYTPKFFIQGSYKMKTLIRTKDDTCDLDDGIHFERDPDVSPTTLQEWVYDAVEGHTTGGQEHREKCIRVIYKGDYHIDLPVYKNGEEDDLPFLAVKEKEWDEEESDPKGFVDWFSEKKTDLIVRTAKYLKIWGDNCSNKMPSGLAMTLFAESNIQDNERDDVSLTETLKQIKASLEDEWVARMPTKPNDDVLSKYDDDLKSNFFDSLDDFIGDAEKALAEKSVKKASELWRNHLGSRFPLGEDEGSDDRAAVIGLAQSGTYKPYLD